MFWFVCLFACLFVCLFPHQFTVRGSQCFKEWSPWCWGSRPACLPLPFICLPGSVLVVGFPAGLSPTSFYLSPTSFLSPRLGACGPVPGWLASHFLAFVSHFLLFVSHFLSFVPAGLSPTSLICLPFPFNCLPVLFICLPVLFICPPGWVLVVGFPAGLSPTSLHLFPTFSPNSLLLGVLNSFLRCVRPLCHCWCPPISTGRWSCSISIHLSPRSVTAGPPFSAGDATFLFIICLPGLSLAVSALFRWRCNISIHLFPRFVTAGVRPFPLAMQHFYSFVSRVCHWCCRPFPLAMLFICLPYVISFFLLHWCFLPCPLEQVHL